MSEYQVCFVATASCVVTVEAEDEAQARDMADDAFEFPGLCAQCSGWGREQGVDLGDWQQNEEPSGVWLA